MDPNLDLYSQVLLSAIFSGLINSFFFENQFGKYLKYPDFVQETDTDLFLLALVYHFLMLFFQKYQISHFDAVLSSVFFLLLLRYSYPVAVNIELMLVFRLIGLNNYIFYVIFLLTIAIAFRVIIIRYLKDK
jgi:hypothetical protein